MNICSRIYWKIINSIRCVIMKAVPELKLISGSENRYVLDSFIGNSKVSERAKLYHVYQVINSEIGDYTYIARNSCVSYTRIGKFCSIGPNFLCGWGIHPLDGISTAPMFYSTMKQNGLTLSSTNKVEERKPIVIGNDVFIGANVTILDGVKIGDGAVIGAGAVVSKDIPPYAIAVGSPIRINRYRFPDEMIKRLRKIQWWDFDEEKLRDVESMFFEVNEFIKKYDNKEDAYDNRQTIV